MASILYFGDSNQSSTSAHRANALKRLGHTVVIKDPFEKVAEFPAAKWTGPIHYRTGYRLLQVWIAKWVSTIISTTKQPDLVWVDSGELFGPEIIKTMKSLACPVVLYNVDDPTGKRDGHRFDSLVQAIPLYDVLVVVRRETEEECLRLGAKRVMRVFRSYDEKAHNPFTDEEAIPASFKSDVVFIGTWMRHEKRDEFILELINKGVPISIWGDRWTKSPYWKSLQSVYRGGALGGREYVAAIQGAKICLGFLSKGNRDLHTQRSLEVPYAGGLFCAERTAEHLDLYREGVDAVFWSDAAECATVCHQLLENDSQREAIRLSGMRRVREGRVGNEDICKKVLDATLGSIHPPTASSYSSVNDR
ncbi:CgeB family protein [Spirosoma flavum]|uniref:Glycosyltransferase n=1 Tax=Spirosoma flavum TaxID=2048557 RepID=A0ABW6AJH5_9BACT